MGCLALGAPPAPLTVWTRVIVHATLVWRRLPPVGPKIRKMQILVDVRWYDSRDECPQRSHTTAGVFPSAPWPLGDANFRHKCVSSLISWLSFPPLDTLPVLLTVRLSECPFHHLRYDGSCRHDVAWRQARPWRQNNNDMRIECFCRLLPST